MRITRLKLLHFRNHMNTEVEWAPGVNLITGKNGSGKTSLIDGIHYLCMSKSFVSNSDMYVINQDESFFMIEGDFEGEIRSEFTVSCSYSRGDGKKIFVNDSPLERLSDLIGMVPVVVLAPDDKKLTREGPAERRAFFDAFISQISPAYLRDLIEYRRIRKQRNKILQEFRGSRPVLEAYLEPWTAQLIEKGSKIVHKRYQVLEKFKTCLDKDYAMISGMDLTVDLIYQTFCEDFSSAAQIEDCYRALLEKKLDKEIEREQTLIGPHRDEVVFFLDNFELRNYGSQGQHRLFALALKLAQLHYYADELDDLPILLLDDVFGDLDPQKVEILLEALQSLQAQIFITSANKNLFAEMIDFQTDENSFYEVLNEKIHQIK